MTQDQSTALVQSNWPVPRQYLAIVTGLGLDSLPVATSAISKKARQTTRTAAATAANDNAIPESSRNNTLASLAGTMRRKGMPTDAIEAALQVVNLRQCKPSLDPSEVTAIANSIGRYAAASGENILETLNDASNAVRFARKHESDAMYVVGLGWHLWDGLCWQRDSVSKVTELAKVVARAMYAEAAAVETNEVRDQVVRHAKASLNAPRLHAMVQMAQSVRELVAKAEDLDSHDMLLGVANGVINLKTGKLQGSAPTNLLTRHSPVAFDPTAKCPRFVAFIDEVTGGDKMLAAYIQGVVG